MPMTGKLLGAGNTADVYDIGEGRVLKLFHAGYPLDAVQHEYRNSLLINELDIPVARSHGLETVDGRHGIVYDRIDGENMLNLLFSTQDMEKYATLLARIQKQLHARKLPTAGGHKAILLRNIENTAYLEAQNKRALTAVLERLPDGDGLCHGDFHFGNVLLTRESYCVIDYMNICRGDALGDIARTVYLIEMTPAPPDHPDKVQILRMKRMVTDMYLHGMDVDKGSLSDWLIVVAAARLSELQPHDEEMSFILKYLAAQGYS